MKNLCFTLFFCSFYSFGQSSLNDFKTAILPLKFDFQTEDNQYRLNSSLKFELEKLGFEVLTSNAIHTFSFSDRCQYLYIQVTELSSIFNTKIQLNLNDCQGNVVFQSVEAKTKEKNKEKAFKEVTKIILESLRNIEYQYNGKVIQNQMESNSQNLQTKNIEPLQFDWTQTLYAQKTENGYQLIDTTPKVVLKITPTSRPDTYLAEDKINQTSGIVFKQGEVWVYEVSINTLTKTYTLNIKF